MNIINVAITTQYAEYSKTIKTKRGPYAVFKESIHRHTVLSALWDYSNRKSLILRLTHIIYSLRFQKPSFNFSY